MANATAEGIRKVANAIVERGGRGAVNLRIEEGYIEQFGKLEKENNSLIIPSNLSDIAGIAGSTGKVIESVPSKTD
ncbi:MAG: hypothetical protein GF388_05325 [Candidatus Aegiribacteria sp.]|nr:hypothetical protein [Candidatus Aegiribacteria sp.]MBD3294631.1 hypothetical protein [Candidatus Fermentibacteria bacterium]